MQSYYLINKETQEGFQSSYKEKQAKGYPMTFLVGFLLPIL